MHFISICFVILFNSMFIESAFRCDYKYNKTLDAWIRVSFVYATWRDARLQCTLEGAVLATPNDTGLIQQFFDILFTNTRTYYMWTGIHAIFSKGDYYTIEGTPVSELPLVQWHQDELKRSDVNQCVLIGNNMKSILSRSCEFDTTGVTMRPFVCIRYGNEPYKFDECGTHDTEYHYNEKTGKCYKFHTVPRNFSRAYFTCEAEGGHLAIINSEDEHTALVDLFKKYPESTMIGQHRKDLAFIGFHAWGNWFDWRTIHDQTLQEAGYSTFATGEPNAYLQRDEFCGTMFRGGYLNDCECHKPIAFICEKSPDFPAVCHGNETED